MKTIYLDNAATTRVSKPVLDAMLPFLTDGYGNPSSQHSPGRFARKAMEKSRDQIAKALGARPEEIYFTGSGSESITWAIIGAARANKGRGRHIVSTRIEHHAVLHTLWALENEGFEVTYLPVDKYGLVNPDTFADALRSDTSLASVMMANNEIGTIQPVERLAEIAHAHGVPVHTDAVAAVGSIPINLENSSIDMLSLSGHKFHAPKGVGVLCIRNGVQVEPMIMGGAQERSMRAGTENVASIVGMGAALELAVDGLEERSKMISQKRDWLTEALLSRIPNTRINGHPTKRHPGNIHISIEGVDGDTVLQQLDLAGICASAGSACASGSPEPSHVLLSLGLPRELAYSSIRFSINEENTMQDLQFVVDTLTSIVQRMRFRAENS